MKLQYNLQASQPLHLLEAGLNQSLRVALNK